MGLFKNNREVIWKLLNEFVKLNTKSADPSKQMYVRDVKYRNVYCINTGLNYSGKTWNLREAV